MDAMLTTREQIERLEQEFAGKHYSEIPMERLDEIDFGGYGWPIVNPDGLFQRVGGIGEYPELENKCQVIVLDEDGTDWMLEYWEDDDDPVPNGMRLAYDD